MSAFPSTNAHLSNLFNSLFAAFCPICWVPIRREERDHYPKNCPHCTAPLLPADLTKCTIELNRIDLEQTLPFGPEWLMPEQVSIPVEWNSTIHSEPFTATGTFMVTEEHCRGHFPGNPILPGVLLSEAANQVMAAIIIVMRKHLGFEEIIDPKKSPYVGMVTKFNTTCRRGVLPGDLLTVKVMTTDYDPAQRRIKRVDFKGVGIVDDVTVFETKNTIVVTTREVRKSGLPFNGVPAQAPEPFGTTMTSGEPDDLER